MSLIVRLSANSGPFSKGIRFMTWNRHSHADFLLDDGTYLGAIPFPGVCKHGLLEPVEDFYEFKCSAEQKAAVLAYAEAQVGKPYDYGAIFGFIARETWAEENKWFCSELIAGSFAAGGLPLFSESASKITPRDLAINALFTKIEKPGYALR